MRAAKGRLRRDTCVLVQMSCQCLCCVKNGDRPSIFLPFSPWFCLCACFCYFLPWLLIIILCFSAVVYSFTYFYFHLFSLQYSTRVPVALELAIVLCTMWIWWRGEGTLSDSEFCSSILYLSGVLFFLSCTILVILIRIKDSTVYRMGRALISYFIFDSLRV